MAASDIFTLNTSIAPRLLRVLYGLTVILIGLMAILGVAQGIALMASPMRPMRPIAAVQAPAKPAAQALAPQAAPAATAPTTNAAPATTPAPAAPGTRMAGPGRRGFPGMGARFHRGGRGFVLQGRGPGMMRGAPPVLAGSLEILRTLIMGAIALMVVRILAEIALALLGDRRQSP